MAGPVSALQSLGQKALDQGLDKFSPDDFYYIIRQSSTQPERLILVGGQALETWGVLLDVPAPVFDPPTHQPFHALTVDADWLGTQHDAQWLADLLDVERTELHIPQAGDPTPNAALLYLQREGRLMLMDFMGSITGLDNHDIRKRAAEVALLGPDGSVLQLRVLDPIHCLISRLANLKTHPEKRNNNGLDQAHWAIQITAAYLSKLVSDGMPSDKVRQQCQRLADAAIHGAAEYCYTHYQLDPMAAVQDHVIQAGGPGFANRGWPTIMERTHTAREKWARTQAEAARRRAHQ